jgi:hypothetical protein
MAEDATRLLTDPETAPANCCREAVVWCANGFCRDLIVRYVTRISTAENARSARFGPLSPPLTLTGPLRIPHASNDQPSATP